MSEFEKLQQESAKLTAAVEELLRHINTTNLKAANYLSGLHIDPLPAEQ
jgi:hypothetical protein